MADAGGSVAALEAPLRRVLGADVAFDVGTRALYASDASNYRVLPGAVAAPRSVDQLAEVVALCAEGGVPLTIRGAGTSLAGNAIGPGVVMDASRHLDAIVAIDPEAATAVARPGTVLDDVNRAAAIHGLRVGPDPSTHDRCTVGGMVGNNACGPRSVRWGSTADNVLALELVTADGSLRHTGPGGLGADLDARLATFTATHGSAIRRDLPPWSRRVSGYGLGHLLPEHGADVARALVGSEGTCAVVSAVTLRLVPVPAARMLLVLGFSDDVAAAAAVPALLGQAPLTVESLTTELLVGRPAPAPLPAGRAWLLVEADGETVEAARDHARRLAAAVGERPGDGPARLIEDPATQQALWRIREDGAGRAARLPDGSPAWPGFEDAAVPPERLAGYLAALHVLLSDLDLRGTTYGHFGEGCVHLRVGFGLDRSGGAERLERFMTVAADLVVGHGGTLSGEHGDGRARGALLDRQFGPELMAAFAGWKAIWDPANVLNPGIIVDPIPLTTDLRRPRPTLVGASPALAFGVDGGDLRTAVERCIGLGRCVSRQGAALMCPSYRATRDERHSTRGRARLLQEMLAGSLAGSGWRSAEVRDALDLCLSCKGCLSECPTGVDMASYKSEFLHHHYRGRLRPRAHYSLGWLPAWLRLARRLPAGPRLANALTGFPPTRRLLALVTGMAGERAIPRLARETFVRSFRPEPGAPRARGRVVLWPDTFDNHLSPEVAHAAARVLRTAGFEVAVPTADVCCGLTWITTGQLDRARSVLRRTLEAPGLKGDAPIVVLEPSCAAALRRDLRELLPDDPRAHSVSGRVVTLAELLDGIGWTPPRAPGAPAQAPLVQPHCHQQAVLGEDADRRLMARAGIEPSATLSGCCGLAGNFGAESGHERVSRAVAELSLAPALRTTDAAAPVIADGFSCRTQVAFLSGRRARHLAEVLADRL